MGVGSLFLKNEKDPKGDEGTEVCAPNGSVRPWGTPGGPGARPKGCAHRAGCLFEETASLTVTGQTGRVVSSLANERAESAVTSGARQPRPGPWAAPPAPRGQRRCGPGRRRLTESSVAGGGRVGAAGGPSDQDGNGWGVVAESSKEHACFLLKSG